MNVIGTPIHDGRINSTNILVELSLIEYYELSHNILKNNEYQRKRVKGARSVYSLLKDDLQRGCLFPPIVLALSKNLDFNRTDDIAHQLNDSKSELVILDGLQRSYTIKDLIEENKDSNPLPDFFNHKIRVEIYCGINKLGILYRMLTLNTGQTPMSTRHQIEMIYSDYLNNGIEGIIFIKETDSRLPQSYGEFKFRDVIEGFTSFLERDYLTLERTEILDRIKSLEKLAHVDPNNELFEDFVKCYSILINKIITNVGDWDSSSVAETITKAPYGRNIVSIFSKSQTLTGFGAAIGKLIDLKSFESSTELKELVQKNDIDCQEEDIDILIKSLDFVASNAKKIGNDQRMFFYHFFKALLDKESDNFLCFGNSVERAMRQYEREAM